MFRGFIIGLLITLCWTSAAIAGMASSFYSSGYAGESVVITAVDVKDRGIYNLVVSVQFLRKPRDSKIYKSDEYEELIDRLSVESRGIVLQKILETGALEMTDFLDLKNKIQAELESKASELKNKLLPGKDAEIVFSIGNFFLLEPKEK